MQNADQGTFGPFTACMLFIQETWEWWWGFAICCCPLIGKVSMTIGCCTIECQANFMIAFSLAVYMQSALMGDNSTVTKALLDCLELDPSIYVRMQVFVYIVLILLFKSCFFFLLVCLFLIFKDIILKPNLSPYSKTGCFCSGTATSQVHQYHCHVSSAGQEPRWWTCLQVTNRENSTSFQSLTMFLSTIRKCQEALEKLSKVHFMHAMLHN